MWLGVAPGEESAEAGSDDGRCPARVASDPLEGVGHVTGAVPVGAAVAAGGFGDGDAQRVCDQFHGGLSGW